MSSVTYRHEDSYSFKKKGVKHTIRQQVIDGPLGLTVLYLKKVGDDFYKIYAKEIEKDKFLLKEKTGEDEKEKEISEKELIKLMKTNKLDNVIEFITKERGTYKGKKVSKILLKKHKVLV